MPAPVPTELLALGDARFVALTTFRRSGQAVTTPVWIAPSADGEALLVTTIDGSGKVKRLRRDPHVTLRPCSRRGEIAEDAAVAEGVAEVCDGKADREETVRAIRAKYGSEYRIVMLAERLLRRGRRAERVSLRIRPVR